MTIPFRLVALPAEPFATLSDLDDDALAARGIRRQVADARQGYPCRVSLEDAIPGENVLLLPFDHQPADSPYRARGPIFVREGATSATPAVGEVPEMLRRRLLSVRAYDGAAMMVGAEVVEGRELELQIDRFLADPRVAYLHLHNARPGCYACRVDRA